MAMTKTVKKIDFFPFAVKSPVTKTTKKMYLNTICGDCDLYIFS